MKNKAAVLFVVVFLGGYLVLNIIYGLWVSSYSPSADPLTNMITRHASTLLNLMEEPVSVQIFQDKPIVSILKNEVKIIGVYEGCNGANVMIIFVTFVLAYRGSLKTSAWFIPLRVVIIYVANQLRILFLYFVAGYWSQYFYYFHKYLFTAFIYLVVFILWIWWMRLGSGFKISDLFSRNG